MREAPAPQWRRGEEGGPRSTDRPALDLHQRQSESMSAYDPSPADAPEKVAYYMSYLCWAILAVTVLKQVL